MKSIFSLFVTILSSFTYLISLLFISAYISIALKLEEWTNVQLIDNKFKVMMNDDYHK